MEASFASDIAIACFKGAWVISQASIVRGLPETKPTFERLRMQMFNEKLGAPELNIRSCFDDQELGSVSSLPVSACGPRYRAQAALSGRAECPSRSVK